MAGITGYQIRRIGPADVDLALAWRDMFNGVFEEAAGPPPSRKYMAELLSDPRFIALAALHEGMPIGGIAAYELRKYEAERSEIYLYDLAVEEPYRRCGVATALIEHLREHAAACGAWMIFVQADQGDDAPIALYAKLGSSENVLHFDIPPAGRG